MGKLKELQEGMMSKDDEYETISSMIKSFESLRICSGNDTLSSCQRTLIKVCLMVLGLWMYLERLGLMELICRLEGVE